jgi:hypothetical protein
MNRHPFPCLALVALLLTMSAVGSGPLPGAGEAQARVAMGAYIPGADRHPNRVRAYARTVGRTPAIVNLYKNWGTPIFERRQLKSLWRRGAVTMITWEPWGVSLRGIARGRYDRYLAASARAAVRWNRAVFVRFAHEMNGNWYPWGIRTPARVYKAAWRHVVWVFRREGAGKVRWVWTPYASNHFSFTGRFPGNRWVDWVGLDGFNWGGSRGWVSFRSLFGGPYRTLSAISSAPMMLAEVGCGESGGSKGAWVTAALNRAVPHMRRIRAFVWFSQDSSRGDFRVDSSHSALRPLRHALQRRRYQVGRRELVRSLGR